MLCDWARVHSPLGILSARVNFDVLVVEVFTSFDNIGSEGLRIYPIGRFGRILSFMHLLLFVDVERVWHGGSHLIFMKPL